jgi:hypothetical protein
MKPGTAKIMTEYPEVGRLYRVHPWNVVHVAASFIPSGPLRPLPPRNATVDLDTAGRLGGPIFGSIRGRLKSNFSWPPGILRKQYRW